MKTTTVTLFLLLAILPARASTLDCRGVLDYDDGVPKGSFRCVFDHGLRSVSARCHDGDPACDRDATCDDQCRFDVCRDASCNDTVGVAVPLRRGRRGKLMFRSGGTRVVLRCLPPRKGSCVSNGPTTTTTTSTTLPARRCSTTLSGAVGGSPPCAASFGVSRLGLTALVVHFADADTQGTVAVLLIGKQPGTYRLGQGVVLAIAGFNGSSSAAFHASDPRHGQVVVQLDSVTPSASGGTLEAHGTLDATLVDVAGNTLRVQAEF